ncbi:MAG: YggS family pyridoxal phosphate-dependent enzyme [Microscillaceae bacterium]|nr:YggS family pyridoxal phosphate-dependent enzyme [Microscillaceae bacterium]MDW8461854.1 YggS family pyridoxal phosphate-dependent enzyme [Cytophagales bacterium]
MSIKENLEKVNEKLKNAIQKVQLVVVTKTHSIDTLQEAYEVGLRHFGENKVQELLPKYQALPKDICWHLVGHLQTNKVKYIAPFVHLIHSVDSYKLLQEINKQALRNQRVIDCLLQIYIAQEETKFGLSFQEAQAILQSPDLAKLQNIRIVGLMGMATFTSDTEQIRQEFLSLKTFFEQMQTVVNQPNVFLKELSMGMSQDFEIAIACGSTMVRIGSAILGNRSYA